MFYQRSVSYRELAVVSKSTVSEVVKAAASFLARAPRCYTTTVKAERESLNNNKKRGEKKKTVSAYSSRFVFFLPGSLRLSTVQETAFRTTTRLSRLLLCSENTNSARQNVTETMSEQ